MAHAWDLLGSWNTIFMVICSLNILLWRPLKNKESPSQNINSAEVRKTWLRWLLSSPLSSNTPRDYEEEAAPTWNMWLLINTHQTKAYDVQNPPKASGEIFPLDIWIFWNQRCNFRGWWHPFLHKRRYSPSETWSLILCSQNQCTQSHMISLGKKMI